MKRSNYDAARAHGNYNAEPADHAYTDTQAREAFEGLFHDVGIVLEALGYYVLRSHENEIINNKRKTDQFKVHR